MLKQLSGISAVQVSSRDRLEHRALLEQRREAASASLAAGKEDESDESESAGADATSAASSSGSVRGWSARGRPLLWARHPLLRDQKPQRLSRIGSLSRVSIIRGISQAAAAASKSFAVPELGRLRVLSCCDVAKCVDDSCADETRSHAARGGDAALLARKSGALSGERLGSELAKRAQLSERLERLGDTSNSPK